MKLSYNKTIKRFIISERGVILHTCVDFGDAQRIAGLEPEPLLEPIAPDTSDPDDETWMEEFSKTP